MEIKLREWIGARANIFFIAAEAGSGKTNLLAEIQKQYAERHLPSLLIRAGRMEKQSLKEQIAYLLNIDLQQGIEKYTSLAGTQAEPTFILIDGLNEANHAEAIWKEILSLSTIFEPGSLKFVITNRANTKADLERYLVSDKEQEFLYGENKDNEKGLGAYAYWLTALNMKEMKGAWENYVAKDKARFKPQFTFDAIAEFDRGIYNQINNPLILRLFLEIYNGKLLPKKGNKHLHIWSDWLKTFSYAEQTFFTLLADAVWDKGENELLLDDLLNDKTLKPYFTSDVINAPYVRLKNLGWISSYTKDLNSYVGFTVEGSLLYLLGKKLQTQTSTINLEDVKNILQTNNKLQTAAIEAFLGEEALIGNLDLLSELIDTEDQDISICITPLVLFLKIFGVKTTIEKVLENPTENDWKTLLKLDIQLDDLQLHVLRKEFLTEVMQNNDMKIKESLSLGFEAIKIFDKSEALYYFEKINTQLSFIQENGKLLFLFGDCQRYFSNYDKALEYYEKTLSIYIKTFGGTHSRVANLYNNIGLIWDSKGEYDKALEYYEKTLSIYIKKFGDEHPDVAMSYNNIGTVSINTGEIDKGLKYFEKSLAINLKTYGGMHPRVATSYYNAGVIFSDQGEYDKSHEYLEKCLTIQLITLGDEHPDIASSYNGFGTLLARKGENDKALVYFKKSLAIHLKTFVGAHPDLAKVYCNIGIMYGKQGKYDEVIEYFENSLVIQLKTLGNEHPNVATSYNYIGTAWDKKGEYDKALGYYEKCLAIQLKTLGSEHLDVGNSYFDIGNINKSLKKIDLAIDNFNKGFAVSPEGCFPYEIAQCYEEINQKENALENYVNSASIWMSEYGKDNEVVQVVINNVKRLSKELNKESDLPEWMR
jgi:tetratricopeptide (TPR) repeat protein